MIKGLYETHICVKDLKRSVYFYKNILGLELCYEDVERNICFFWIGQPQKSMLGIWEQKELDIEKRHFAFACDPDWILKDSVGFLSQRNIEPYNFLNNGKKQPMVFAWMPAVSIYFNDPDGHVLEFIGILIGDPKPKLGVISYEEWMKHLKSHT
jgi:catechol 2,3-dioxygenase-like lactoylglutathione lyase family enzyme